VATVGLTPGWVTFGLAVPEGKAVDGLTVERLATQTDEDTMAGRVDSFRGRDHEGHGRGSYPIVPAPPRLTFTPGRCPARRCR
jgi:hypothetical protein